MKSHLVFAATLAAAIVPAKLPAEEHPGTEYRQCLQELVLNGPDERTIGEMKAECGRRFHPPEPEAGETNPQIISGSPVAERLESEKSNINRPFTLMAHRANYILLAAHNFNGWEDHSFADYHGMDRLDLDDTEIQFQLSLKTPLAVNIFRDDLDLYAGYTMRSFWQAYNGSISSPFRDTNHEPEVWLQHRSTYTIGPFSNTVNVLGINHQSNGQSGSLSRSWNRIYGGIGLEYGDFAFLVKPWIRIHEPADQDDNPDITDYLGHGSFEAAYKYRDHTFTFMSRNNLESGFSRGAFQIGWSFPLFGYDYIKGYIQYFSGYGESLIDYNRYVNRIGFGFALTDLL